MLKKLMKAAGLTADTSANELVEAVVEAADLVSAAVVVPAADVEALTAEFAEFKASAEAAQAALTVTVAELTTALATATEALAATKAEAAQVAAAALATKMEARKEKVTSLLGTVRADALLQVTEGMDDAAFDAVVSALGIGAEAEAEAPLFKEVGVAAQADAAVVTESAEMRILKQKFGKK